jgi:hypothetical protein
MEFILAQLNSTIGNEGERSSPIFKPLFPHRILQPKLLEKVSFVFFILLHLKSSLMAPLARPWLTRIMPGSSSSSGRCSTAVNATNVSNNFTNGSILSCNATLRVFRPGLWHSAASCPPSPYTSPRQFTSRWVSVRCWDCRTA